MPNFRVVPTAPSLVTEEWVDPDGTVRPSRAKSFNDQIYRHLVVDVGETVRLEAIVDGATVPSPDTATGLFTAWAAEYPRIAGVPAKFYPTVGYSSRVDFILNGEGHYTLAMRREDADVGADESNGGFVFVHIDVRGP